MDKTLLNEIEDLAYVTGDTRLFGYDKTGQKVGFVPANLLTNSSPIAGWKRKKTDAKTEGTPFGDFEFIANLPSYLQLGGYLVQNNHQRKKLSAKTHLMLANGETCVLDGSQGHYQWGWGVPFYYATWEDDTWIYEAISLSKIKGHWNYYIPVGSRSAAGYCILDTGTGALKSVGTATVPVFNKSIITLQAAAAKNGDLWFANERVMNFVTGMLKRIYFHNGSIQAAWNAALTADGLHQGGFGNGYSDNTPWDNGYLPLNALVEDGDALEVGSFTGDTINKDGAAKSIKVSGIPNFFGLKNDFKYLWCMSENELLQCNADNSQTLFIDNSVGKVRFDLNSIAKHVVHSKSGITATDWQFPKRYNFEHLTFWPIEGGGSESSFYGDGYYNPNATSGLRGVGLLGLADHGGNAGSLSANGGYGVGDFNVNWSAFLCEWAEAFSTEPEWVE